MFKESHTHTHTHTYIYIYISMVSRRTNIQMCPNSLKHILFHEQLVYEKGTKMEKKSLVESKIVTWLYHSWYRLRHVSSVQRSDKRFRKDCWYYHLTLDESPSGHTHSLREIIIYCLFPLFKMKLNLRDNYKTHCIYIYIYRKRERFMCAYIVYKSLWMCLSKYSPDVG